jgi:hypothetical protein
MLVVTLPIDPEKSPTTSNIVKGSPESFGWQRRPDYDTQATIAYEAPDGTLKAFRRDRTPELTRPHVKLPFPRDHA